MAQPVGNYRGRNGSCVDIWDEFCSLVERPLLVCLNDFELLRKVQVAPPCGILVCCGSPPNRPFDVNISVFVLQRPDLL